MDSSDNTVEEGCGRRSKQTLKASHHCAFMHKQQNRQRNKSHRVQTAGTMYYQQNKRRKKQSSHVPAAHSQTVGAEVQIDACGNTHEDGGIPIWIW